MTRRWSRRQVVSTGISGALAATGAIRARAQPAILQGAVPQVVIVGGGAGGATLARAVAQAAAGKLFITLIEPNRTYRTCFFSNLYLGGYRTLDSIGHGYGALAAAGVNVVHDLAVGVDRDAKHVRLGSGVDISYDRLVVSPGIDFKYDSVPGHSVAAQNKMPHAWKAGSQTALLKAQLAAMKEGGLFVMVPPSNPYRCPPGPYERISMVAHYLKENNPTAKIVVLDPKEKFSKQALFQEGWDRHYEGMVEWLPASITGGVTRVDAETMTIETDLDSFNPDVANIVPAQKAGKIAELAGLTNDSGFSPIEPASMRSQLDEAVFVLGDATIAGDMPKSGFSANSQAKVAAMTIRADLTGSRAFPARFANTCWSLIATEDGVKVGARYEATDEKIAKVSGFISKTGEDAALRKQTYEESLGWYAGITTDMFGV